MEREAGTQCVGCRLPRNGGTRLTPGRQAAGHAGSLGESPELWRKNQQEQTLRKQRQVVGDQLRLMTRGLQYQDTGMSHPHFGTIEKMCPCLLYTSDAADE